MTGATGFLGLHLLSELAARTEAEIYCLVRAADRDEALARLESGLRHYRLWRPDSSSRIVPVVGDLAEPRFGTKTEDFHMLSQADAIVHNGARVNHAEPYARLRGANVVGTRAVLRSALSRGIPVHIVSTTSVAVAHGRSPDEPVLESDRPSLSELPGGGYTMTKWVGEELMAQAAASGLPVAVYRPDRVCGRAHVGAVSTNDAFWTLVRAAVVLGAVPTEDAEIRLIPADYVAAAVVHILLHGAATQVHHLVNHTSIPLTDLWDSLRHRGYRLAPLPISELAARLTTSGAGDDPGLARAVVLSQQSGPGTAEFDDANTAAALAESAISCPPMTIDLLDRHLDHLIEIGFLPPPAITGQREGTGW
ncbi:thioester reductase domain-containing protein [Nocardia abscessus]|uniref:thioester reductase domain-containing protein n=1 Tax=Nocardia abscessus TaxID=120957 RepID=UPI0018950310|nr:thioester reductase domain-containing protein [Nocardia abscessus]MBF6336355.1 thioester reductase domain-containing protein [Nocardia abscessus]